MLSGGVNKNYNSNYKFFDRDLNLTLGDGDISLKYEKDYKNKSISFPKLTTLLSHLSFITLYWDFLEVPKPIFLVVGEFSEIICELYPQFIYHIYNKEQHNSNSENIIYHNDEFTPNDWTNRDNILFVSNLIEIIESNFEETEAKNIDSLLIQQEWVNIIKPVKSLIKIRLPYNFKWQNPDFEYFNGILYLRQWVEDENTELSLVVNNNYEIIKYNIKTYENLIFHHRKVVRQEDKYYNIFTENNEPISISLGLYNDYDSTATAYIISEYFKKYGQISDKNSGIQLLKIILENVDKNNTLFKLRVQNN